MIRVVANVFLLFIFSAVVVLLRMDVTIIVKLSLLMLLLVKIKQKILPRGQLYLYFLCNQLIFSILILFFIIFCKLKNFIYSLFHSFSLILLYLHNMYVYQSVFCRMNAKIYCINYTRKFYNNYNIKTFFLELILCTCRLV